jgi:hypothetical protein
LTTVFPQEGNPTVISTIQQHRKLWASALMIAILLMLSLSLVAAPKTNPPAPRMPDVLIWIDARNPQANWVAITYPKVISRTAAETSIATLLRETGWAARNIDISDGSVETSGENPMTAIQFVTTATVQPANGYLPIEPIIRAFRTEKRVDIQYMPPPGFLFRGIKDFSNQYVQIKLISGNNAYRYSVQIKDPSFTTLNLPKPGAPASATKLDPRSQWTIRFLIIVLASIAAVIAFMISVRFVNSRARTSR